MQRKLFLFLFVFMVLGGSLFLPRLVSARNEEECHNKINECDTQFDDFDGRTNCYKDLTKGWYTSSICDDRDIYGHLRYSPNWPYYNLPEDFSWDCFSCIAYIEFNKPQDRDKLRQTRCVDSEKSCSFDQLGIIKKAEEAKPDDPPISNSTESCDSCKNRVANELAPAFGHAGDQGWINDQFFLHCPDPNNPGHQCGANPKNPNDPRNPINTNSDTLGLGNFQNFEPIGGGFGDKSITGEFDINNFLQDIMTYGSAVFTGLAMLKIIFGGVMYATAAGNAQRISDAKSHILYALLGIALIAGANIILWFLGASNNLPSP